MFVCSYYWDIFNSWGANNCDCLTYSNSAPASTTALFRVTLCNKDTTKLYYINNSSAESYSALYNIEWDLYTQNVFLHQLCSELLCALEHQLRFTHVCIYIYTIAPEGYFVCLCSSSGMLTRSHCCPRAAPRHWTPQNILHSMNRTQWW